MLVDEKLQPKGVLKKGDRKYLQTDHVRLQPGAANEVAVVKWIFHRFLELRSEKAIARELNQHGIPTRTGGHWRGPFISRILKNENYVGNLVYNRRSRKLRGNHVNNPPESWVRSEGCIEPVVGSDVFHAANKIIEERRVDLSEQEMLVRLRRTLMKEGRLSPTIISKTVGLPCPHVYIAHFGSLRNAYRLVGYTSKRNCGYIDSRQVWADELARLASQITATIEKIDGQSSPGASTGSLRVNGMVNVFFRVARWIAGEKEQYSSRWMIQRRRLPDGWIVAIRLDENNKAILDYLLVPTAGADGDVIRFTEKDRDRRGIERFETSGALVRSVSRRVTKPNRTSTTKPAQPAKQSRSSRPKRATGPVRR